MNDDYFDTVWREQVFDALLPDDRKRLEDVLLSSAIITYRLANNEYRETDKDTMQENYRTYQKIVSKINTN